MEQLTNQHNNGTEQPFLGDSALSVLKRSTASTRFLCQYPVLTGKDGLRRQKEPEESTHNTDMMGDKKICLEEHATPYTAQSGQKRKRDSESTLSASSSQMEDLLIEKEEKELQKDQEGEIKRTPTGRKRKMEDDLDAGIFHAAKKSCLQEESKIKEKIVTAEKVSELKPEEPNTVLHLCKTMKEKTLCHCMIEKGILQLTRLCEILAKQFGLFVAWWKLRRIQANPDHDYALRYYSIDSFIGQGSYGQVYAGYRKRDNLPVAIKFIKKSDIEERIKLPEEEECLPLEIALLELVKKAPASPYVIQLLDHFETSSHYLLVMERPEPCKTLFEFMNDEGQGKLQEPLAKIIFRQIVEAIIHCLSRGIFHTDIKLENILIQKTTYQVKLIDFGCAIYEETDRAELIGDQNCFPPEFFLADTFVVEPANVWALGVNLFYLVCGHLPFRNTEQLVSGIFHIQKGLSRECESLIRHCLAFKEDDRPTPEEILLHPWLD